MYSFFTEVDRQEHGQYVVPIWEQLKVNIAAQHDVVEMYYRNTSYGSSSAHFFVRLLQSISIPKSLSDVRYYENMLGMALNFSMAMQMTSSIYKGKIHSNILYGKGSQEIVIATAEEFDYEAAIADWRNIRAVRVVRHPRSDLLIAPLDGRTESLEQGISVIIVNLPLLALQYRSFILDEFRKLKAAVNEAYSTATTQHFVYRYIFTSAVRSHIDVALLNRLSLRLDGQEPGTVERRLPVGLADYTARIDYVLNRIATQMVPEKKSLQAYLTNLPAINAPSQSERWLLPDIAPTRQVSWALNYSVEPLLKLYLRAAKGLGARANGTMIYSLTRLQRSLTSDTSYHQVLPPEIYLEFKQTLSDFINMQK